MIQVEEPTLHFMARYNPDQKEFSTSWSTPSIARWRGWTTSRSGSTPAGAIPTCRRCSADESYANSIEIYLERLKGDVWTIEATENNFRELPLFESYKDSLKKKIAVGVISHRTLQADFPDVIAERIRRCLKHIPADKLICRPTAALAGRASTATWRSTRRSAIPHGAEHHPEGTGLEPRYVPAADEKLAWDQLPDYEPFTHLKPLR